MKLSLTFLGGAQTVTGSKFLLEAGEHKILVDCGLFQGIKELRLKNWASFPLDPKSIDAVIVTHAHLDHVGYLPILIKDGFRGKVYCTPPTRALADIILLDSGHIQEEDAQRALQQGYSRHPHPRPLFNTDDCKRAMTHFEAVAPDKWNPLLKNFRFRFIPNGHILGSACVEINIQGKHFVFSGDLGRTKPLILPPPKKVTSADYLIVESTYGDRRHPKEPVLRSLAAILKETYEAGGDVLIPSFAVGRSQDLLHLLAQLKRQNQLPPEPIFFDSPMGINATHVFCNFKDWHKLNASQQKEMCDISTMVLDAKISMKLAKNRKPKIILAGSGMMTGGRVLNHLHRVLPDKNSTILLVGYQAPGTRGRLVQDGAPEIKLHGAYVPVKCRVVELSGLSAHADQFELVEWLRNFKKSPTTTFLVHGEPQASDALRVKIKDSLGWDCEIPGPMEKIFLK